jgi:hypothetical protein
LRKLLLSEKYFIIAVLWSLIADGIKDQERSKSVTEGSDSERKV